MTEYNIISEEGIKAFNNSDTFIPIHMRDSIIRYLEAGQISSDSFLAALLNNNLKESCSRADDANQEHLVCWVRWLWNYAPVQAWGYPDATIEWPKWLKQQGLIGSQDSWEVYNPNNKPVDELPTIYGFNNGGGAAFLKALLIAEDGTWLGSHICSAECYMEQDLGIRKGCRPDRHETFKEHYPDGYRMEFVSYEAVEHHEKLMAAVKIAEQKHEAGKGAEAVAEIEVTS